MLTEIACHQTHQRACQLSRGVPKSKVKVLSQGADYAVVDQIYEESFGLNAAKSKATLECRHWHPRKSENG